MADRKFDLQKQPAEKFTVGVDFANDLGVSETISSAVMSAIDTSDGSNAASIVLDGSASIVSGDEDSSKITQKLKGGSDGKEYKITFLANTSMGNVFAAELIMNVVEI